MTQETNSLQQTCERDRDRDTLATEIAVNKARDEKEAADWTTVGFHPQISDVDVAPLTAYFAYLQTQVSGIAAAYDPEAKNFIQLIAHLAVLSAQGMEAWARSLLELRRLNEELHHRYASMPNWLGAKRASRDEKIADANGWLEAELHRIARRQLFSPVGLPPRPQPPSITAIRPPPRPVILPFTLPETAEELSGEEKEFEHVVHGQKLLRGEIMGDPNRPIPHAKPWIASAGFLLAVVGAGAGELLASFKIFSATSTPLEAWGLSLLSVFALISLTIVGAEKTHFVLHRLEAHKKYRLVSANGSENGFPPGPIPTKDLMLCGLSFSLLVLLLAVLCVLRFNTIGHHTEIGDSLPVWVALFGVLAAFVIKITASDPYPQEYAD